MANKGYPRFRSRPNIKTVVYVMLTGKSEGWGQSMPFIIQYNTETNFATLQNRAIFDTWIHLIYLETKYKFYKEDLMIESKKKTSYRFLVEGQQLSLILICCCSTARLPNLTKLFKLNLLKPGKTIVGMIFYI